MTLPPDDEAVVDDGPIINHTGLCVTDLERSQRFYVDVLGFAVDRVLPVPDEAAAALLSIEPPVGLTAVYLTRGPFVLELIHFDRPGNPESRRGTFNEPGLTHISFSVDDVDAALAQVADAGGQVVTTVHGAAMVRDPDGQLLELLPMSYHHGLAASRAQDRPG